MNQVTRSVSEGVSQLSRGIDSLANASGYLNQLSLRISALTD